MSLQPDPRLNFLHRAHARLILVENGLMTLAEAFDGLIAACHAPAHAKWSRDGSVTIRLV